MMDPIVPCCDTGALPHDTSHVGAKKALAGAAFLISPETSPGLSELSRTLSCAKPHSPNGASRSPTEESMNEDGVNTSSAMDAAIKGWNEVDAEAHPLRLEEASASECTDKVVPVKFTDLVQVIQAMGRMQKQMQEQLELLVASSKQLDVRSATT